MWVDVLIGKNVRRFKMRKPQNCTTETTTYHANEIATASGMREHSACKREIAATATACQGG